MSIMRSSRRHRAKPTVPRGLRVYAVGDIHGCAHLLDELIARIDADWRGRPAARKAIVFLGDYIDRGPDSAGVIDRLRALAVSWKGEAAFVMGNHEEVLVRILDGETALLEDWLRFGGRECLLSYGADPDALSSAAANERLEQIRAVVPQAHQRFLRDLVDTVRIGDYLFVHAGIRPGVDLRQQTHSDLRWIRAPFLDDAVSDHGVTVVHGHTIVDEVEWRRNRIGIDTGAYWSDRLTALVVEGEEQRLLSTEPAEIGVA